jgi:hypothetical protein
MIILFSFCSLAKKIFLIIDSIIEYLGIKTPNESEFGMIIDYLICQRQFADLIFSNPVRLREPGYYLWNYKGSSLVFRGYIALGSKFLHMKNHIRPQGSELNS